VNLWSANWVGSSNCSWFTSVPGPIWGRERLKLRILVSFLNLCSDVTGKVYLQVLGNHNSCRRLSPKRRVSLRLRRGCLEWLLSYLQHHQMGICCQLQRRRGVVDEDHQRNGWAYEEQMIWHQLQLGSSLLLMRSSSWTCKQCRCSRASQLSFGGHQQYHKRVAWMWSQKGNLLDQGRVDRWSAMKTGSCKCSWRHRQRWLTQWRGVTILLLSMKRVTFKVQQARWERF